MSIMRPLTLTYSLADQNFKQTKSVGIFNVSTQLLENLSKRTDFSRLSVLSNSTLGGKLNLPPKICIEYHDEAIGGKLGRIFWDQFGVYEAAKKFGNQWLFLPKGFAPFLSRPSFKLAVYSYDSIHDFYRAKYPGAMSRLESLYFTQCLKGTFKYADVIFTDSDFAKNELKRLASSYKFNPLSIITAGVGFSRIENTASIKKRDSIVLLTSVWPHKLSKKAVNFIERWQRESGFSGSVDLVGSLPVGLRLPQLKGWEHHPRLSEQTYRQFIAESKALLFFSEYEGFGMPPVEAMIAGTCPVYSDLPVTREVMGGRGFSFSNDSYESFRESLNKALSVSDTKIRLWAEELLERHSWDKTADKIINGLKQAAE